MDNDGVSGFGLKEREVEDKIEEIKKETGESIGEKDQEKVGEKEENKKNESEKMDEIDGKGSE